MLAEVFFLKSESILRASEQGAMVESYRFIPFPAALLSLRKSRREPKRTFGSAIDISN